jgi:hypothetical protein
MFPIIARSVREGALSSPPRSPDLTSLDFFFWGFVKDVSYRGEFQNVNEIRDRLLRAAE